MIICKICNKDIQGNGYCGLHSTSSSEYADNVMTLQKLEEEILKEFEKEFWNTSVSAIESRSFVKSFLSQAMKKAYETGGERFKEIVKEEIISEVKNIKNKERQIIVEMIKGMKKTEEILCEGQGYCYVREVESECEYNQAIKDVIKELEK